MDPTPRLVLDLRDQRYTHVDRGGPPRVMARHGGLLEYAGGAWRWRAAPFWDATSSCGDGADVWVATAAGLLWHGRDERWTSIEVPELARGSWQVLARDGRVWLLAHELVEVRGSERVRSRAGGVRPPCRVVGAGPALLIVADHAVERFDAGAIETVVLASSLPERSAIRAAAPAPEGGVFVVDEAGALLRARGGSVEVLRPGRITVWYRHTYPDPDPDMYDDRVAMADVAPSGVAATWRFYDQGRDALFGEVTVTTAQGDAVARWRADRPRDMAVVGDRAIVVTDGRVGELAGAAPLPRIEGVGARQITVSIGGATLTAPVRGPDAAPVVQPRPPPVVRGEEVWHVTERGVEVRAFGVVSRFALDATVVGVFVVDGWPLFVDAAGTQRAFDGAALREQRLGGAFGRIGRALRLGDEVLRLAAEDVVFDVPLLRPGQDPPLDIAAQPGPVRTALARGVAELGVHVLPIARHHASAALRAWGEIGPTAAGLALSALWAGDEDSPGPADHDALASRVMRSFATDTSFRVLEDTDGVLAWAAIGPNRTVVTTMRASERTVLGHLTRR